MERDYNTLFNIFVKFNALYPWMYNGSRVCKLEHEQHMVSPLVQGISFPRRRDMVSLRHKEPKKNIVTYMTYMINKFGEFSNNLKNKIDKRDKIY